MPPRAAPRSMKSVRPWTRRTSGEFRSGLSGRPSYPSRQPPEGFTTAVVSTSSPFGKGEFPKDFFMPRCGATFDENTVPPCTRGDFRGVLVVTHDLVWAVDRGIHPGAAVKASQAFTPSDGGDFQRSASSESAASVNRYYSAVHFIQFTSR